MAKYLISFPSATMIVPDGQWEAVVHDSHAVIDEAIAAGVYVFGGGIDQAVPPILVSADGAVATGGYPWAPTLDGDFTVLELRSRDDAIAWAARIAKACRCDQELRVFGFDPASRGQQLIRRGKCGLTIYSGRTRFRSRPKFRRRSRHSRKISVRGHESTCMSAPQLATSAGSTHV